MSRTRQVLSDYGYRPVKRRGQNFLISESILEKIAAAAAIRPDETVVEIGPGPGNLTRRLVRAAKQVIAIEIEPELCAILKAELQADNLTLLETDALSVDFAQFAPAGARLKVVANLPYNLTTPLLFKFIETPAVFSELLLLVQKEVAQRISAGPGTKSYGILAVQTQLWAAAEIVFTVGPEAFRPQPKVSSALLRLHMRETLPAAPRDPEFFKRVVRAAFARRRKTLANSLAAEASGFSRLQILDALAQTEIDPRRRPETLTVAEFVKLANVLEEVGAGLAPPVSGTRQASPLHRKE